MSLPSTRFEQIPGQQSQTFVTKLEEDKISAFVAGGEMYEAANLKRGH